MSEDNHEYYPPTIFDLLLDDDPSNPNNGYSVIPREKYKQGLIRDMQWLLSTHAHFDEEDGDSPELYADMINPGMRQIFEKSNTNAKEMEKLITNAIKLFEPRMYPSTIKVSIQMKDAEIQCEISGDCYDEPVPLSILVKAKIDRDDGRVEFE